MPVGANACTGVCVPVHVRARMCVCVGVCTWLCVCGHAGACTCMGACAWFPSVAASRGGGCSPWCCRPHAPSSLLPQREPELAGGAGVGTRGSQQDRDAGLDAADTGPCGIVAPWVGAGSGASGRPAGARQRRGAWAEPAPHPCRPAGVRRLQHWHGAHPRQAAEKPGGRRGSAGGRGGTGLPPATVAPGPAARPAASCAGAHCSAAPGCGAGFLCQSSAIFYSNNYPNTPGLPSLFVIIGGQIPQLRSLSVSAPPGAAPGSGDPTLLPPAQGWGPPTVPRAPRSCGWRWGGLVASAPSGAREHRRHCLRSSGIRGGAGAAVTHGGGGCESQPLLPGQDAAPHSQLAACQRWTTGFVFRGVEAARCPGRDETRPLLFRGGPQHPGMLAQLPQAQLWGGMRVLWAAGASCILALPEAPRRARAASSLPLAAPVVKKAGPSLCKLSWRVDGSAQVIKSLQNPSLGASSVLLTPPHHCISTLQAVAAESPARCCGQSCGWSWRRRRVLLSWAGESRAGAGAEGQGGHCG